MNFSFNCKRKNASAMTPLFSSRQIFTELRKKINFHPVPRETKLPLSFRSHTGSKINLMIEKSINTWKLNKKAQKSTSKACGCVNY